VAVELQEEVEKRIEPFVVERGQGPGIPLEEEVRFEPA
jgi:hypothetical protein